MNKSKIITYLVVIFLAGAATGGSVGWWVAKNLSLRPPDRQRMAEHHRQVLIKEVGLSPEQMAKANPIIERTGDEIEQQFTRTFQEVDAIVRRYSQDLMALMDPAQKARYEEIERHRQEDARRHHPPKSKPPPSEPPKP
jgi:hypothetical protein